MGYLEDEIARLATQVLPGADAVKTTNVNQNVDGIKTFLNAPVLPANSIRHSWIKNTARNLADSGVVGDGITDHTTAFQTFLDAAGDMLVPAGTYMVNPIVGLKIKSNSRLVFAPGAVVQAITVAVGSYGVVKIEDVENVTIHGLTVIGDRVAHNPAGAGEHGHGIIIQGNTTKNVHLTSVSVSQCWGDGIAVYNGQKIRIDDAIITAARRNGLTVTNVVDLKVRRPRIIDTGIGGIAPQAGIDIEPNANTNKVQGIVIDSPYTENSAGAGIIVALATMSGASSHVSITITNHEDNGSNSGFYVGPFDHSDATSVVGGSVNYVNGVARNNKYSGISIETWPGLRSPALRIENPTVIDCNTLQSALLLYGSAIVMYRKSAGTYPSGNCAISGATIVDTRTPVLTRSAIIMRDDFVTPMVGASFLDPLYVTSPLAVDPGWITDGVTLSDVNKVFGINTTTSAVNGLTTYIDNAGSAELRTHNIRFIKNGNAPVVIRNSNVNGMRIVPHTTETIVGMAGVGKYIQSYEVGAEIELYKSSATTWTVRSKTGRWSSEDGTATITEAGKLYFDSAEFKGADDDATMDKVLVAAYAYSRVPVIQLPARVITLALPHNLATGVKIVGAGSENMAFGEEVSSGKAVITKIRATGGSAANSTFRVPGSTTVNYATFANIAFHGDPDVQIFHTPATSNVYGAQFHNLNFYGCLSAFGNSTDKFLMTRCDFTGYWTINAPNDMQINIGGSDNTFWFGGGGANIGGNPSVAGAGRYLVRLDGVSKSDVGYAYITANNGWRALDIRGNSSGLVLWGGVYEGQNDGDPSNGNLIRVSGVGTVRILSPRLAYGMASPSAGENGIVEVAGTDATCLVHLDGASYRRKNAVAETVALAHVSGGKLRVLNAMADTAYNTWTGLPRVTTSGTGTVNTTDGTWQ